MRKLLFLLLFFLTFTGFAQKYTIKGYIKDGKSGESLIGATVLDAKSLAGTTSNYYGFYSVTLPKDSVKLIVQYVGYQPQQFNFILKKDTAININLLSSVLEEVVISSERNVDPIQEVTQMSSIKVPIAQIKALPALMGEVDVLKVMQLLPGVQSGNEGGSGLYVRGGGPDQNLILLDGVPVYNASHLFGFFSVFNSDAINHVELIKGGFPARYGGRLSSVIDINMKEGNKERLKGEGSVGLVASRLTLEGPIDDKSTFIISGRRTYIDILSRPFIALASEGNGSGGYYFYDLNAKLNRKLSDRDRIYLSAYMGDDKAFARYSNVYYPGDGTEVRYRNRFGLNWGNITSAFRWNHEVNNKLFSNTTLTYSRYRFNIGAESYTKRRQNNTSTREEFIARYYSGIEDFAAKVDFDFLPNPDHYIRFGANAIHHTFDPGAAHFKVSYDSEKIDTTFAPFRHKALEFAAYIEDDYKISSRLKANAGLHLSGFLVGSTFYPSLQPRVSGRYLINSNLSAKISYAKMTQFIHLLTNSGLGMPTDLWLPSTEKVAPQQSDQIALGIAQTVKSQYEFSVEAYYKDMRNVIEYKDGAGFENVTQGWEEKIEVGNGRSYGAEFFLQKKEGRFSGWIGYTLSWTERQFENLNNGNWFPFRYDRRHDISIALMQNIRQGVDFSAVWVFGTGNAITLPVATYNRGSVPMEISDFNNNFWDQEIMHYDGRNGFRMRNYHRLDLNISFKKQKRWGERAWTVGTYNTYSRYNPFFMDLGYDRRGNRRFIQYTLFPLIPSVTYNFKF